MENDTVNIDDLRNEWTARDANLQAMLRLNTKLLRGSWRDQHRPDLKETRYGVVEVLTAVPVLLVLGSFAVDHFGEWRFFVPAVALHLWTLVMLVVGIVQRVALRKVDFGRQVVELQRELATLRRQRMTAFKWALLTGQVVWWIPFMIVLFAGSDFMPVFIAINLLASLAFIPVAIWLAARYGKKIESVGVLHRIADSLAGSDMKQADAFIERLARFEGETEVAWTT
jgi:hypothetical protein